MPIVISLLKTIADPKILGLKVGCFEEEEGGGGGCDN